MQNMGNRLMTAVTVALLLGTSAANATEWQVETRTERTTIYHCYEAGQPACPVVYVGTWITSKGYFNSQQEAASACSEALGGNTCGYASGEPGPPMMSGGWASTCPGGVNQYRLCVSTVNRHATAYFPSTVVEQDIERPADCRSSTRQFGNPIDGLTGEKHEQISLLRWSPHAPPLTLHYRSGRFARQVVTSTVAGNNIPGLPKEGGTTGLGIPDGAPPSPFGPLWTHSLDTHIRQQPGGARISRMAGSGGLSFFGQIGVDAPLAPRDRADTLQFVGGAGGVYWRHRDPRALRTNDFAASGRLVHAVNADGTQRLRLHYSDASTPRTQADGPDRLLIIQDAFDRRLHLTYHRDAAGNATGLVRAISTSGGERVSFDYDSLGRLTTVRWGDGSAQRLAYDAALPWALSKRIDETGVAVGNWTWDAGTGLVTSTAGADGVNRYALRFAQPPFIQVSDTLEGSVLRRRYRWQPGSGVEVTRPNGATVAMTGASVQDDLYILQRSQPAGAGCDASTNSRVLDANGNAVVNDDFAGGRSCHAYDMARNLELVRVEGLDQMATCAPLLADGAALPPGARKITTRWHPVWPLAEVVASPSMIEHRVYNTRPDPLGGNAQLNCMPDVSAAAGFPDIPPAALCRRLQRATTDVDGRLGLQAMVESTVSARDERWTYNGPGMPLSHDGPRDDVADVTTYTYHATTSGSATAGDLLSVRNPAGQYTWFNRYNRAGQLIERQDGNGVLSSFTYDMRQRLVLTTQAGQGTQLAYAPNGLLTMLTLPDGSRLSYGYDNAQRLIAISDSSGNRIHYTLDNAGQRVAEERRDAQGQLSRRLTRVFDALGRVQEQVGRP